MEKTENKALEAKELDINDLAKISGGSIIHAKYSAKYPSNIYDTEKEVEKVTEAYYVPKNGKYYKSLKLASAADKALGGDGVVSDTVNYSNCFAPQLDDISWEIDDTN